jgi:hypothetical protein
MDSIQTLADNESLLDLDTLDALAKLETPGEFYELPRGGH